VNTRYVTGIALFTAAILCGAVAPASAQSGITATIKIAIDPSIGGTMHGAAADTVNGVRLDVPSQTWTDTHSESSPLFVGGVDIPVGGLVRILGNFEYGRAGADMTSLGTANGQDLQVEFDPYKFWGLESGVRVGGASRSGAYAIATVGFRYVSELDLTVVTPGLLSSGGFYGASTVPTYGFGGGYMFGSIGIEAMVKYSGALDVADDAGAPFVTSLANAGERWSLPISLVLRF
jgi:hypothetical protein